MACLRLRSISVLLDGPSNNLHDWGSSPLHEPLPYFYFGKQMKELDVNNYDPKTIFGISVGNEWFEALNMTSPVFVDPDVARIYRICLDWDTYKKQFVPSVNALNKEKQLKIAVERLIVKYSPERMAELKKRRDEV